MSLKVKIYTLSDPIKRDVRYVGKTIESLNDRLKRHLRDHYKTRKSMWIRSLRNKGLTPVIELIEEVEDCDWENEEKFYISYFRFLGFNLTNHSEGGRGGKLYYEYVKKGRKTSSFKQLSINGNLIRKWNSHKEFFKEIGTYPTTYINNNLLFRGTVLLKIDQEYDKSKYKTKWIHNNSIEQLDVLGNVINEFCNRKEAAKYFKLSPSSISLYCLNRLKNKDLILRYKKDCE